MKKGIFKVAAICIIIGALCILIGVIKGASFRFRVDFTNRKIITEKDLKDAYTIFNEDMDKFDNIKVDLSTENLKIVYGDSYHLYYKVESDRKINAEVVDNTLKIWVKGDSIVGFSTLDCGDQEIVITVPKDTKLENLRLDLSTGDIVLEDIDAKSLVASISTGDIRLESNKIDDLNILTSTGGVQFENLEIGSADIEVSTGDVKGNLLKKLSDYNIDIYTSTGDIVINQMEIEDSENYKQKGDIPLTINSSTGDVELYFEQ